MVRGLWNIADHLKRRWHNKSNSKQKFHSWHNNYTFIGHILWQKNSNQTTRRSQPGDMNSWVWECYLHVLTGKPQHAGCSSVMIKKVLSTTQYIGATPSLPSSYSPFRSDSPNTRICNSLLTWISSNTARTWYKQKHKDIYQSSKKHSSIC